MSGLHIVRLDSADARRRGDWDAFVHAHPDGTVFHLSGWKPVLERAFGHRVYLLAAMGNTRLRGILPLVHKRSRLFETALISNAFCVYGGPLVADDAARASLDAAAIGLARELGVGHLEYRLRAPLHADWPTRADRHATFRKAIAGDHDANLKAIPRKQRAVVRKALGANLETRTGADVDTFYRIYAESVRNLGTPVFAKRYIHALMAEFGDRAQITTVWRDGRPLSGVLSLFFRDEVVPYYGGGRPEARQTGANDLMYWAVMRAGAEAGCRVFDFGRSKVDSGAYHFKKNWGFQPSPLYHEYKLLNADAIPDTTPTNPKYRLAIRAWQRLPLWAANRVGPLLAPGLG
jgi:FemAB-related protein (PEP-CTERM system-associated)